MTPGEAILMRAAEHAGILVPFCQYCHEPYHLERVAIDPPMPGLSHGLCDYHYQKERARVDALLEGR